MCKTCRRDCSLDAKGEATTIAANSRRGRRRRRRHVGVFSSTRALSRPSRPLTIIVVDRLLFTIQVSPLSQALRHGRACRACVDRQGEALAAAVPSLLFFPPRRECVTRARRKPRPTQPTPARVSDRPDSTISGARPRARALCGLSRGRAGDAFFPSVAARRRAPAD